DWAYARTDAEGKRLGDELDRTGWKGGEQVGDRRIHALFELHIEQGPILEAESVDIGVVTHGQGLSWTHVTLTGTDAHTGSTPMHLRRNAGLGMARIVDLVDRIARDYGPDAVGTVGHVEVFPNSRNVIPGRAEFTVDFRSPQVDTLRAMEERLHEEAGAICDELDLGIELQDVGGFDPVAFDQNCIRTVRGAAETLGYSHRDIVAGAGHDACWIARVAPVSMIMCPCVDGLSHNEAEEITPQWATAGANVLLRSVVNAAGR